VALAIDGCYVQAVYLSLAGDHATACTALRALNCRWKLSPSIWAACSQQSPTACTQAAAASELPLATKQQPAPGSIPISGTPDKVLVVDRCLPSALIGILEQAFSPAASYWGAHSYWQLGTPFFSYLYQLVRLPAWHVGLLGVGRGGIGQRDGMDGILHAVKQHTHLS
jgi:hypothetical protein